MVGSASYTGAFETRVLSGQTPDWWQCVLYAANASRLGYKMPFGEDVRER